MHSINSEGIRISKVVLTKHTTFTKIQFYKAVNGENICFFEKDGSLENLKREFDFTITDSNHFDTSNLTDRICYIRREQGIIEIKIE